MLQLTNKTKILKQVTPYKDSELGKKEQVTKMFDNISDKYDVLNRVISFRADKKWRKRVVKIVNDTKPNEVLDIATGTGDLAIALSETSASKIIGLDISEGMLNVGRKKIEKLNLSNKIEMVLGDSEKLPFVDNRFDAITVAFGVRNFENLRKGLSEILRVLRPGGIFVVLETSVPTRFPFKQGYHFYTKKMMPFIGKMFSKDKSAYQYLANSAVNFPHGKAFNNILEEIGFIEVENLPQFFGSASIYVAKKR